MLKPADVKDVFAAVPKGSKLYIADIQALVRQKCSMTKEDFEPYTDTRKTNYCKWTHCVQRVLYELKRKGVLQHDEMQHTYRF